MAIVISRFIPPVCKFKGFFRIFKVLCQGLILLTINNNLNMSGKKSTDANPNLSMKTKSCFKYFNIIHIAVITNICHFQSFKDCKIVFIKLDYNPNVMKVSVVTLFLSFWRSNKLLFKNFEILILNHSIFYNLNMNVLH